MRSGTNPPKGPPPPVTPRPRHLNFQPRARLSIPHDADATIQVEWAIQLDIDLTRQRAMREIREGAVSLTTIVEREFGSR